MDQIITELTSTATIAIAVFGIAFCLMQTKYSRVNQSFAMFLGVVALNNIPDALARIFEAVPDHIIQRGELVIWFPSGLGLAPLFWVYVFTLTSPTQQRPTRLGLHLAPMGLAALLGMIIASAPPEVSTLFFSDDPAPIPDWAIAPIVVFGVLQLVVFPQIAIYLFLIVRRLMRYRVMLRDVYASTEKHELRWIYAIGGLGAVFWGIAVVIQFLVFDPGQAATTQVILGLAGISGLALVAITALWGLRQRPPLVPNFDDANIEPISDDQGPQKQTEKYEKSALSAEASARIARKLRAAMEQDRLHRDPNLSLWVLARHIGASSNYISQTLSEVIGQSFFDFVNAYRIAEAKELLAATDETVLAITYEVGFNARSSFYNAFKRVTGQTPTKYRQALSQPVGMDDTTS